MNKLFECFVNMLRKKYITGVATIVNKINNGMRQ